MKHVVLALLLLGTSGCAVMEALLVEDDSAARYAQDERYRGEARRNQRHEETYRREASMRHHRVKKLDRELREQRRKIDREVEKEFALELARRSPLGHGDVVALFPVEAPTSIGLQTLDALDALLFLELTKSDRFRFVPRRAVAAAIDDVQRGSYKSCVDERCAIEIGRAVAAERVLAPRLYRAGETCILALTLFDLRTETGEWATTTKVPCEDRALRDGVQTIAARIEPPADEPSRPVTAEKKKKARLRERPLRTPFSASEAP